jgi:hypothetical protein
MVLIDAGVQSIELFELRGVDGNTGGIAHHLHRFVQFSLAAAGDVNVGALFSKAFSSGQADAGSAASYQSALVTRSGPRGDTS